jgi:hypothetical protein
MSRRFVTEPLAHFAQQPHPVVEGAAVFIGASVGVRRKELAK